MNLVPLLPEVDAVAGAEIESQFRDSLAYRLHVAEKSVLKPINADADSRSGLDVEAVEPDGEWLVPGIVLANEYFPRIRFQFVLRARRYCDI